MFIDRYWNMQIIPLKSLPVDLLMPLPWLNLDLKGISKLFMCSLLIVTFSHKKGNHMKLCPFVPLDLPLNSPLCSPPLYSQTWDSGIFNIYLWPPSRENSHIPHWQKRVKSFQNNFHWQTLLSIISVHHHCHRRG